MQTKENQITKNSIQEAFNSVKSAGQRTTLYLYQVPNVSLKQQLEWFRQGYFPDYKYFVDFNGNKYTRGEK